MVSLHYCAVHLCLNLGSLRVVEGHVPAGEPRLALSILQQDEPNLGCECECLPLNRDKTSADWLADYFIIIVSMVDPHQAADSSEEQVVQSEYELGRKQKQMFLIENVVNQGYDTQLFSEFMLQQKGNNIYQGNLLRRRSQHR